MINQEALAEINAYTVHALANLADINPSVSLTVEHFLGGVRDDFVERTEYADESTDWYDIAHEIADVAVPVYTSDLWETFAALNAWQEDITIEDMTRGAQVALYSIAERLVTALAEEAGAL